LKTLKHLFLIFIIAFVIHDLHSEDDINKSVKKNEFVSFDEFKNWQLEAQKSYIDSLNDIGRNYTRVDREISNIHAYQALNYSLGIKYKSGEAYSYRTIASVNLLNGNYFSAVDYIYKSIEIFETLNDQKGIADANFTKGLIYRKLNKFKEGLEAHQKAFEFYQYSEDKRKGIALFNLADSYFFNDKIDLSEKYLKEAFELALTSDDQFLLGNCYNLKSKILKSKGNDDEALEYANKIIQLSENLGAQSQKVFYIEALITKASIYKNKGNYNEEITHLKTALDLSIQYYFTDFYTTIYIQLFDAFLKLNKIEEAKTYLSQYNIHRKSIEDKIWNERAENIFQSRKMGNLIEQNQALFALNEEREQKLDIITKTVIIGVYCLFAFLIGTVYTIRLLGKTKKNEAQLNAFYENAPLGIVFLDKGFHIIKINKTIEEFLDWKKEKVIDKNLFDVLGLQDGNKMTSNILDKFKNPTDIIYRKSSKKIFDLKLNITQIDLNGVIFYIAFIEDKTLKETILKKNIELNELLNETYRIAGLGSYEVLFSKEMGFEIQSFSNVAKELLGIKKEKVRNSIFDQLIPKNQLSKFSKIIKEYADTNEFFDDELKVYHTNGTLLYLRVIGKVEFKEPGQYELKGIFQDITQRKLLIQQLEQNLNKEKELNNLKSRFISMTSHEFKTPLSTISSSTELIEIHASNLPESGYKEKILSQIQRIYKQISRLGTMMSDILMLEKNQANLMAIKFEKLKIGEFLKEFAEDFEPVNDSRKLKLILPKEEFEIVTDKNILFYILTNLTTNAFKYSPDALEPEIQLTHMKNAVKISIKDYGIGIPAEEQKHIFDSFFRGKNVATIKGTGLGLFIVKEFLQKLNGNIKFSSVVGEPTVFEIRLPIGQTATFKKTKEKELLNY
jgi:PAS domain S-box-containing protein